MEEARRLAMNALEGLRGYANEKLKVVLFSGEGDSLHQIFDCIVQVRRRARAVRAPPHSG